MTEAFVIPDEYKESFRRLLPYMALPLRNDQKVYESLLIFLKLGGERLARIALEAFNETQRLNDAELKKRLREEELLRENGDAEDEDENADDQEDDESFGKKDERE